MSANVTVKESIWIAAPIEAVWDFTQNYAHRREWDDSILEAEVVQEEPARLVRIRAAGGVRFTAKYTLFRRPHKTSLAMVGVRSSWVSGGGGSWLYEEKDGGTLWTQTNTLSIKHPIVYWLLRPVLTWQLRKSTRRSMQKAKALLERRLDRNLAKV